MIIAIQAGDKDKDPAQTRRHMMSLLLEHSVPGDSLVLVDQPTTMVDQVYTVSQELGLDVISVTPDFMLHGTGALGYAIETAVTQADKHLLITGPGLPCTIDLDFLSYVSFFGYSCSHTAVPHERIEVV